MHLKSDSKDSLGEGPQLLSLLHETDSPCRHCKKKPSPLESCSKLEKKTDVLSQIEGVYAAPFVAAAAPGHSE